MKNLTITLALCSFIFAACNNQSKTNTPAELSKKMNEPTTCYSYTKDNNNVQMQITIVDNLVSGYLLFEYYQKDKNSGIIKGEMKGDTLYAEYSFISEGVNSVKEVAFLKKEDEWTEGFGDIEEQSGKMVFKNKATLKFENNIPLTKTECNTDEHGSLLSFGYVWSSIKNSSVKLSETATRLNPIEVKNKEKGSAYIIFSNDKSKAELFLPTSTNSFLLTRKGTEGNYIWTNDEFELLVWKGYVLKKNKVTIYGGA